MTQAKHMTPESMTTISARLIAAAELFEKRTHKVNFTETAALLREADEIIKTAVDVSSALMARLLAQSLGLDGLLKPKAPPSDEIPGGLVETTKDDYVAYIRKRADADQPDRDAVKKALIAGNAAAGVSKVVEIDDDMGLVKHIRAAESALPGWVGGYVAFKRPDLVGG